jgi:hypothetical protein
MPFVEGFVAASTLWGAFSVLVVRAIRRHLRAYEAHMQSTMATLSAQAQDAAPGTWIKQQPPT